MKYCALVFISAIFSFTVFPNDPVYTFSSENEQVMIVEIKKETYIITSKSISRIGKKQVTLLSGLPFHCNAATVLNDLILMATDSGIISYSVINKTLDSSLLKIFPKKIDAILTDAMGTVWFSSKFDGVYRINPEFSVSAVLTSPVTYCMGGTADSSVWVGTNIGLYKISAGDLSSIRYAEEGIEGYSIPDNLVENIFTSKSSGVWAKLSETLVFIDANNQQGDIPSFDHVGDKSNLLLSIAGIDEANKFLFVTSGGIIYLPAIDEINQHTEIHNNQDQKGVLVSDAVIGKPADWKTSPVTKVIALGNNMWFITERGLWSVKKKKLLAKLNKSLTQP